MDHAEKRFRRMRGWYRKAIALDSTITTTTPVGYRMERAERWILRQNLITGCIAVLVAVVTTAFVVALRRRGRFSRGLFLKRLLIGSLGLAIALGAVAVWDAFTAPPVAFKLNALNDQGIYIQKPIVPLGFLDSSNADLALMVLALALVPVLLAAFLSSIRGFNRFMAAAICLVVGGCAWTLFILLTAYGPFLDPVAIRAGGRHFYNGEQETLLLEDPPKVLRANPSLMKENNEDLRLFVEEHRDELGPLVE